MRNLQLGLRNPLAACYGGAAAGVIRMQLAGFRVPLIVLAVTLAAGATVRSAAAAPQEQPAGPPDRAMLDRYCLACHNDRLRTAGLSLQGRAIGDVAADPAVWEKVLGKLRTGGMPPPDRPRPSDAETEPIMAWLEMRMTGWAHRSGFSVQQ